MRTTSHDEYQNRTSTGSLESAHRLWRELEAVHGLMQPRQFDFAFACPSDRMADGLASFLGYARDAGFVRSRVAAGPGAGTWSVVGTTRATVRSLSCLEHLFMGLRRAAVRYESRLVTLEIVPDAGAGS